MATLREKVEAFCDENGLLDKNDRVLVAFSGGSDSLCMLNILMELKGEYGLKLGAAHVNHLLRGEAADADEEFCRDTCDNIGIPFYCLRKDAEGYAAEKGVSTEVAGREIRYSFLSEVMEREGYNKCATAHNLNDQGETVLLNLIRGTGLSGLTGISARREVFIRPLLSTPRSEIEEYLTGIGQEGRKDATNDENNYSRNKLRNVIIPYIRENFNEDFSTTVYRMAELLEEDNLYIEGRAKEAVDRYVLEKSYETMIRKEAFRLEKAILNRVVLSAVRMVKGDTINIEKVHVDKIVRLQSGETGKIIDIKDDITAYNNYGDMYIRRRGTSIDPSILSPLKEKSYNIPGTYYIGSLRVRFEILDSIPPKKDPCCRYFDLDSTGRRVKIRNRVHGDRVKPLGMTGYKKVKDIFIDRKIKRDLRNNLLVFLKDDEIFYIEDTVTGEDFKVTDKTEKVLSVGIFKEETDDSK
ncbi:MAG: tRNA lysidine(34) synthetase TilS [Youngiibacter sp.]|nr:tRNA lysidine(34) synthetase TilS [Youngiibacter sp.]